MTYPQQPGFPQVPQQPQTPQAPQPQYAPPVYAPPQPQYAPQQQYAPPMYAQPQQYSYPQQAPQGPAQQPAEASLDAFFSQPSVGWGPSITPTGKTPDGTAYMMVVAQHVTASHIEHATKFGSQTELDYYRNGKPKFVMKVPVFVAPGTQVTYGTERGHPYRRRSSAVLRARRHQGSAGLGNGRGRRARGAARTWRADPGHQDW
jgi:hypothetical protein